MQKAIALIREWLEIAARNRTIVIGLLIFVYPLGGYLMWKGEHFSKLIRWIITGVLVLWTFALLSPSNDPYGTSGGGCSTTFEQNGCTYYRDGSCNVIGRTCG